MTPENQATMAAVTLQITDKAMNFLGEIFGEPIKDIAGFLYVDRIKAIRQNNLNTISDLYSDGLKRRTIKAPQPISLSLAQPILEGAADESREEIQKLWAKLLLAATDPNRTLRVSYFFIETVKKLDPIDALMLDAIRNYTVSNFGQNAKSEIVRATQLSKDTLDASLIHLAELSLIRAVPPHTNDTIEWAEVRFTPRGAELMALLSD